MDPSGASGVRGDGENDRMVGGARPAIRSRLCQPSLAGRTTFQLNAAFWVHATPLGGGWRGTAQYRVARGARQASGGAALDRPAGRRQRPRPPAAGQRTYARAPRRLHGARGGRAVRGHIARGRMAARQLPHHFGRRARHPARSPALVLQTAASHRRRRVRRASAHVRARARADWIQRGPARCAPPSAVHQRLPVSDAPHDGRALGLAERVETRAARPPAHEGRRTRSGPHAPPGGGWARRSGRSGARLLRPVAGGHPSCVCHAPARALPCPRRDRIRVAPATRTGAGGARTDDRGRDSNGRAESGGRTGGHGQPDWQPPPDFDLRLE